MSKEKHEAWRYMKGKSIIAETLVKVPQHKQSSFIYECMSYMSDYPETLVPTAVEVVYEKWKEYGRL